ncbi:FeoA domain-containing protein [Lentisphaerota bacterium WC36G]|nr:FeoA domain-containing protein [Lentisphaerae bacterium WC36]
MIIPMREMAVNQKGKVATINAAGVLGRRIRDLGLVPGVEFEIIGRAPLYDPVAVRLKGFTLTLRNSEADYITCEVEEEIS